MSRFRFEVAGRADDPALRDLMAKTPMAGKVSVSFRREPSFFDAAQVEGGFHQTVIVRDDQLGRIAALATRSVRQRFVNGVPTSVGYLSALRLLPEYRRGALLARGYRFLNELHQDKRCQIYLTTIADDNAAALETLTSRRAGLPTYHFAGEYHTSVLPLTRSASGVKQHQAKLCGLTLCRATHTDLADLVSFVRAEGARRQFFPCYDTGDFFSCRGAFPGLEPADLILATRDGTLVGVLGCWHQSSFRQIVVESYDASVRWARPFYNGWAGWRGQAKLPAPGAPLRLMTAALPVVHNDDAAVFSALLDEAVRENVRRDEDYLLLGLHEQDPLLPVVQKFSAAQYLSRLYYVCWPDGEELREQIDDRWPYLELGSL